MIQLSRYAIESMGFTEHTNNDVLSVKFSIIRVYALQGITFDQNKEKRYLEKFTFGNNCNVVISYSVNYACNQLIGEDFVDNEEDFLSEKKAKPPFLLIYFTSSSESELKGGYRKNSKEQIITYDAFSSGKKEIENWEKKHLPNIVTALTVHLSDLDQIVKLVPTEKSIFGKTHDGQTLFDVKITGSAEAYVSRAKELTEINSRISNSVKLYETIDEKHSKHIHMAFNETDRLKQFLYYFLFIERFTHSQYKSIDYEEDAKNLINIPERLKKIAPDFFKERQSEARNLSQRFHWCTLLVWNHLNDKDIECFKNVKKIRDKISHGESIVEASLPIEEIKKLSLKLLGTKET